MPEPALLFNVDSSDSSISNLVKQEKWEELLDILRLHHETMNLRSGNILHHAAAAAPNVKPFIPYFNIDMTDERGRTAVWWASIRGQVSNLRTLLEAGAEPNLADHRGLTPIFVAHTPEIATTLHEFGAHLNVFDNEGTSLMDYTENNGRHEVAETIRSLMQDETPVALSFGTGQDEFTDRFEPIPISPRELVNRLDADSNTLQGIIVDGERYSISTRFLKGLASRMKVPYTVFNLFTPLEVINRSADRNPDMEMRVTLDREKKVALGLVEDKGNTLPINSVVTYLRQDPRTQNIDYEDGVLKATLAMNDGWDIPGDSEYKVQLSCQIPVDGMAQPEINLATYRLVCSNGAVAEESIFRSKMEIKDNSGLHFQRLLQSFSNKNGVEMLHQRLIDANATKASVAELMALDGILRRIVSDRHNQMLLREKLLDLGDNPCARYGVTDLANIGEKKRSLLPVGCSVADLLNFASELGTHHRNLLRETGSLNAFHGRMLAKSFDLEDMYKNSVHARDFHLNHIPFAEIQAR